MMRLGWAAIPRLMARPTVTPASVVFALAVVGCGSKSANSGQRQATPPEPHETAWMESSSLSPLLGADLGQGKIVQVLRQDPLDSFDLSSEDPNRWQATTRGGMRVWLVPRRVDDNDAFRAELAAYALATLLELDNVPPAALRLLPLSELNNALTTTDPKRTAALSKTLAPLDKPAKSEQPTVPVTVIFAGSTTQTLALKGRESEWSKAKRWLRQSGTLPAGQDQFAADVACLMAFDYLTGNAERLKRDTLRWLVSSRRLFIEGNAESFVTTAPDDSAKEGAAQRSLRVALEGLERWSPHLVERIRAADEAALRETLEPPSKRLGAPILSEAELEAFAMQRETLLSYVGAILDRYGDQAVLTLP